MSLNLKLAQKLLLVLVIISILITIIMSLNTTAFLSILLMVLVVILLGYVLSTAIFPKGLLNISESITLALGLGLSIIIILGLTFLSLRLNFDLITWAIALGGVIIIAGSVSLLRKNIQLPAPLIPKKISLSDFLLIFVAALLLVGAYTISRNGAINQPFDGFTQLWMLPADQPDQKFAQIGITNKELNKMTFSIHLENGDKLIKKWEPIILDPGETWVTKYHYPEGTNPQKLTARLFNVDQPQTSYRDVWLWLDD